MGETIFQHTENHSKIPYCVESALEIYDGFSGTMTSLTQDYEKKERVKIVLSSQGPILK